MTIVHAPRPVLRCRVATQRRGAASLVVVMVLFFVITLVAAYTSRNLIFEQRTSANHYRSTLAFEAADAGVEWALARLNDARMNDNCTPLTTAASVAGEVSFRDRYLSIDPATGAITPVPSRLAGCIFDGANWACDCPATGNPNPTYTATGTGPFAAFWVRFETIAGARPGVVRIQVNGCTRPAADCLRFDREAQSGDGLATVWAVLALKSALVSPPAAALTVRGAFNNGGTLTLTNTDAGSGGFTLHAAQAVSTAGVTLVTIPGTPPQRSVSQGDSALALPDLSPPLVPATPANNGVDRMFNSVFGMWPTTYFAQPGAVAVDCNAGCSAAAVNDAILLNPGHAVHVTGAGPLRVDADIGGASAPVVIVADGSVEFTGTPATVYGVVYSRAATWTTGGTGTIQGAAIAESGFTAAGTQTIVYDADLLRRVRGSAGSFTKVPGGWRDFQP
jgi:hypothetical protein